jgi:ABC-type transport system involved in cytochrome c biogenesis permease component
VNAAAVIVRELRAESRRAANYWLRVLAAGALILVFASIMLSTQLSPSGWGPVLFAGLNQTLMYAFWILVPLMTADCVSREKREGTLELLFLTPLTVLDVIAGKAAIHVLRALTLFLAALPILGLPLVLGGVDWRWVLIAAAAQANAVLLGIGAGIYASTRGGSTIQVPGDGAGGRLRFGAGGHLDFWERPARLGNSGEAVGAWVAGGVCGGRHCWFSRLVRFDALGKRQPIASDVARGIRRARAAALGETLLDLGVLAGLLSLEHEPHAGPQSNGLAPGIFMDGPLDQVGMVGGGAAGRVCSAHQL